MLEQFEETLNDYIARLNVEGRRNIWHKNRKKSDFILRITHIQLFSSC